MDLKVIVLVICVTLVFVIGINAAIYVSATRKRHGEVGQIELLRRAVQQARHPWQQEDQNLQELSDMIQVLRDAHLIDPDEHDDTNLKPG